MEILDDKHRADTVIEFYSACLIDFKLHFNVIYSVFLHFIDSILHSNVYNLFISHAYNIFVCLCEALCKDGAEHTERPCSHSGVSDASRLSAACSSASYQIRKVQDQEILLPFPLPPTAHDPGDGLV